MEALAAAVSEVASAGSDDDISMFAVGPCSSAAVSMMQACAVDVVDDLLEGSAICTDILDDDDRADCLTEVDLGAGNLIEIIGDINAGDRVVTRGAERLNTGMAVDVTEDQGGTTSGSVAFQ